MDMNSNFTISDHRSVRRRNKMIFVIFIFFMILMSALRLILTIFQIDPYSNLYISTSPLIAFFDYTVAAVIIAACVLSNFIYKRRSSEPDNGKCIYSETTSDVVQGSQTLVFTSSLTGFILAASSIFQVFEFMTDPEWKNASISAHFSAYIRDSSFDFVIFFAAILASVYFFKTASLNPTTPLPYKDGDEDMDAGDIHDFEPVRPPSQGYILFSFFPIIWVFLNIFKCFFDMSKSVNSPIRIYELVCFLSISLYFVAESRLLIGRRETSKFFTFAYTSMLLISLSALPNLILSAFWILQTSTSMIIYAVQTVFLLYIASRVYSQIRYGKFMFNKVQTSEVYDTESSVSKEEKGHSAN